LSLFAIVCFCSPLRSRHSNRSAGHGTHTKRSTRRPNFADPRFRPLHPPVFLDPPPCLPNRLLSTFAVSCRSFPPALLSYRRLSRPSLRLRCALWPVTPDHAAVRTRHRPFTRGIPYSRPHQPRTSPRPLHTTLLDDCRHAFLPRPRGPPPRRRPCRPRTEQQQQQQQQRVTEPLDRWGA
jgi:hypothetical protein